MSKSVHQIIEEQVKRWEMGKIKERPIKESIDVITLSRECGCQGYEVAKKLTKALEWDLFHNEIIDAMVETSKNTRELIETLDERGMNIVDDIVSALVHHHHLWPDEYTKLLLQILGMVGKHGNAVIVGRGANFVLASPKTFRVRLVAPVKTRIANIKKKLDLSDDDAKKHVVSTDSNRAAFVHRYFNEDVADPSNYDLILNTGMVALDKAVQVIKCAL
ncbi:MAG: cytidylate kinase-like family protein [Desulfobacteraceae bacterium]|nr:cytidylate kinase-like family protein [Desulfobacteraceae bacterium]